MILVSESQAVAVGKLFHSVAAGWGALFVARVHLHAAEQ